MDSIPLGQYLPLRSAIHRLDPRTKLTAAVILIFTVILGGWVGALAVAPLLVAGILLAQVPPMMVWRQVKPLWLLLAITALLQVLFTPGSIFLKVGPFNISSQGLVAGLYLLISILLVIWVGALLTATTTALELASGLESLLAPLKKAGLPVHEVAMAITIAVRFVPDIFEEARNIADAQISRGAGFYGPGFARRAGAVLSLMVPLLAGAMRRSEELAMAMESRCYTGGEGRTRMNRLAFSIDDALMAFVVLGAAAAVAALRGLAPA